MVKHPLINSSPDHLRGGPSHRVNTVRVKPIQSIRAIVYELCVRTDRSNSPGERVILGIQDVYIGWFSCNLMVILVVGHNVSLNHTDQAYWISTNKSSCCAFAL